MNSNKLFDEIPSVELVGNVIHGMFMLVGKILPVLLLSAAVLLISRITLNGVGQTFPILDRFITSGIAFIFGLMFVIGWLLKQNN